MWDLLTYNFGSAGVVGFYFFFLNVPAKASLYGCLRERLVCGGRILSYFELL